MEDNAAPHKVLLKPFRSDHSARSESIKLILNLNLKNRIYAQ